MVMATLIAVAIITLTTDHISADQFVRNKRGLSDFFKRFWNIRKKVNYVRFCSVPFVFCLCLIHPFFCPVAFVVVVVE